MKFKFLSLNFILGILSLNGFSQIYVPGGVVHTSTYNNRVGIGIAEPKTALHVEGSIYLPVEKSLWFGNTTDASNRLRLTQSNSAGYSVIDYYPTLHFRTGATSSTTYTMTLLSNGNVGINAVNPAAKLHVSGNVYMVNGKVGVGTTDPKVNMQIGNIWTFYDGSSDKIIGRNTYWNGSSNVRIQQGVASRMYFGGSGDIVFQTVGTGNPELPISSWNTMIMNNEGNVGIGISAPLSGKKLHVQGDSYFSGSMGVGGTSSTAKLYVNGNSYFSGNIGIGGTSTTAKLYVNGKLGVGASDPKVNMQIGNIWTFYDGSSDKIIGRNTYWNGSSNVRIQQGVASRMYFGGSGDIVFQTVGTGNPGSTISTWNTVAMKNDGSVGIGTTSTGGYKLKVNGKINCTELVVSLSGREERGEDEEIEWPDYVFAEDYNLRDLDEVASFIQKNRRLPEMPSAADVAEKGINIGEVNALLLKKVEELTLYILQQNDDIQSLKAEVQSLKEGR